MAESRVLAASIGLGLAGVGVLSMLAGYSIKINELTRAEAAVAVEAPVQPSSPEPAPVVPRADPVEPAAPEPSARVGAESAELVDTPQPVPTPHETLLPAAPVAGDRTAAAQEERAPDVDTSGTFDDRPTSGDIRSVDFRNGFTMPLVGVGPVVIQGGAAPTGPSGEQLDFMIDQVIYGDATGDGRDDAVIAYHYTDQWDSTVASVRVFSINDGLLQDWGTSWADYWALGEILDVGISPGLITIDSLSADEAVVSLATWAVQGPGISLQRVEALPPRTFVDLTNRPSDDPFEVSGVGGAVRAVVTARGGAQQTIAFDVEQAWSLEIISSSATETTLRVWEQSTGRLVGDATTSSSLQLGAAGRYVGQVVAAADTTFEIAASDRRTLAAPSWVPKMRIETTEDPVLREVRLQWPEFTSAAGAANLSATNATIRKLRRGPSASSPHDRRRNLRGR